MASLKQLQYRLRQSTERIENTQKQISDGQEKLNKFEADSQAYSRQSDKLSKLQQKLEEALSSKAKYEQKIADLDAKGKETSVASAPTKTAEDATQNVAPQIVETLASLTEKVESNTKLLQQQGEQWLKELNQCQNTISEQAKSIERLQAELSLHKKLSDRTLIVESQIREIQIQAKKLQQSLSQSSDQDSLSKTEFSGFKIETEKQLSTLFSHIEKVESSIEKQAEAPSKAASATQLDLDDSDNTAQVSFPQGPQITGNVEKEPLDNIWHEESAASADETSQNDKVVVDPPAPTSTEAKEKKESFPAAMITLLNAWVAEHPFGWSHDDWTGLLHLLEKEGFEKEAQVQKHENIGHYIEAQRLKLS